MGLGGLLKGAGGVDARDEPAGARRLQDLFGVSALLGRGPPKMGGDLDLGHAAAR
jgi:hypothetical protein